MDYDYSPRALEKVIYAGTQSISFPQAAGDLLKLAELDVSPERVRRVTERIGNERVAERAAQAAAFEALPIPARSEPPRDQPVPSVVCVQMDGGRFQLFDRADPERNDEQTFWREMKVGCLWSMTSTVSAEDPCPQLPKSFVDPERVRKMVREIKGFSGPEVLADQADDTGEPRIDERPERPQPVARSVVVSRCDVEAFGPLLASEAHQRGFAAAERKAFVADGQDANWGVQRRHFPDYVPIADFIVPIADFIHVLTYAYAAAMADQPASEGWRAYREWSQWIWGGQVELVIAALELRQQALGATTPETPQTAAAAIVAKSLGYFRNQRPRMDYPRYRRLGLPITSAYVESTVKQVNRRMKGTEKFWSRGAEGMLTLVGDHLSDTPDLENFWKSRHLRQHGLRQYQTAA